MAKLTLAAIVVVALPFLALYLFLAPIFAFVVQSLH